MHSRHVTGILFTIGIVLSIAVIAVFVFRFRGAKPVVTPPPGDIADMLPTSTPSDGAVTTTPEDLQNNTDMPLTIADGFEISVFAQDLPDARVMAIGPRGNLWVSQPDLGQVSLVSIGEDGQVAHIDPVLENLNKPHGLAFDPDDPFTLYVAEESRIAKVTVYSQGAPETVVELPRGGRHFTRTIGFGPDKRLYVSIGSTCDVCVEDNLMHGTIQVLNEETGALEPYATGLRNAVFFTWHPIDGSMWATEMGRDNLGDDLPPDEINKIVEGGWYGWPWYYGDNVLDEDFADGSVPDTVSPPVGAAVNLPAHVAPLGIDVVPEEGWPEEYTHDFLLALHGSWNRSEPVGYKLMRVEMNDELEVQGTTDVISGWLTDKNRALGRPVDVLTMPGGIAYVSDDKAGVIYRLTTTAYPEYGQDMVRFPDLGERQPLVIAAHDGRASFQGEARGTLFFEAEFQTRIENANGDVFASGRVVANDEWTTEEYVPFTANLEMTTTTPIAGQSAWAVFEAANPSGLPENAVTVRYPVVLQGR